MIGEVELPAFCCVTGGNLASSRLNRKTQRVMKQMQNFNNHVHCDDYD